MKSAPNFAALIAAAGLATAATSSFAQQAPAPLKAPVSNPQDQTQQERMQQERMQKTAAGAMFDRLDTNKDGFIDKEEAKAMRGLIDIFDQADTDKDGKLDRIEFEKALNRGSKG